jgi:hypothetical protein
MELNSGVRKQRNGVVASITRRQDEKILAAQGQSEVARGLGVFGRAFV